MITAPSGYNWGFKPAAFAARSCPTLALRTVPPS
jgi:hypothetical protein